MRMAIVAIVAAFLAAPAAIAEVPLVHPDQEIPDSGSVSPITAAFVAAVGPFNGFLEAADRLAAERATGRVQAFALREVDGRAAAVAALQAWAAGIRRARFVESHAPTIDRLGPVFGLVGNLVDIVVVPADLRQRGDYVALARREGVAFEALFLSSQAGTLAQLGASYVDYIKNGDDLVLRALAVRDLHAVRALLAALPRR